MEPQESEATLDTAEPVVEVLGRVEQPWHRFLRDHGDLIVDAPSGGQLEIEVLPAPKGPLPGIGRFENNLARKAIIVMRPSRDGEISNGSMVRPDLMGTTTLTYTLGVLGPREMDICTWVMGRWRSGSSMVQFSLRELSRALGIKWKGQLGRDLGDSLRRLKATTISGSVYDPKTRRRSTAHISIFDMVHIAERNVGAESPTAAGATVTVQLSTWLTEQLMAGQFSDFDWDTYRRLIDNPFIRRLFVLFESEQGSPDGTFLEFPVNEKLGNTIGTDEATANPSRFRSRIAHAGKEICAIHKQYESVRLKAGERRGEYRLEVRRTAGWYQEKIADRRRLKAASAVAV